MKITLVELDNRLNVKIDKSIRADGVNGIMQYGENNDYPQRIERLINSSPTARACANIYSKFLIGGGFEESINNIVIGYDSRHKRITVKDLLTHVAKSISYYNGAYVHNNINIAGQIVSVTPVLFKNLRFSKLDDTGYTAKVGYYENWEKDKDKKYDKNKIKWYNLFNLNQSALQEQIVKAGGIEKYKGQIYFMFLDNEYIYPLSPFDSTYMDVDTEYQLSLHRNNEVRNGFSKKTLFQVNEQLSEGNKSDLSDNIKGFMGSRGDKVIVIETEADENGNILENKAVKIDTIDSNIDSKLYENWDKDISNKIRKSIYALPSVLIDYDESKLGTTSGEGIIQATNFYNQMTKDDRDKISMMFQEIFSNFDNKVLKNNTNWKIKELSLYGTSNIQSTTGN